MIDYKHGVWGMAVLLRGRGSVIPKALAPGRLTRRRTNQGMVVALRSLVTLNLEGVQPYALARMKLE